MRRVVLAVASVIVLLTTGIAWADDLTGQVTAVAGRTVTIKDIVLTIPAPAAGQPDLLPDIHRGEQWSVTYTPGPNNVVTNAVKEPEYGNNE